MYSTKWYYPYKRKLEKNEQEKLAKLARIKRPSCQKNPMLAIV